MKPYYECNGITIYHGDYRNVLPTIPKRSLDMLLVDPPYNADWQSSRRADRFDKIANDAGSFDPGHMLSMAIPTLKPNRHIYCFGPMDWSELPVGGTCDLIWDKGMIGPGDLSLPWGPSHETIHFGVYVPSQANRGRGDGRLAARLRKASVIRVDRLNSRGVAKHPTEKPVPLLRQLIESSSVMGDTVIDPTMGSGSTLIACLLEGRKAIGIDIDERNCESAARDLQQAIALPLFG